MLGVIAGDVIGSRFEWEPIKTTDFALFHPLSSFTDDTVMTVATASAILDGTGFEAAYLDFGRRYPRAGYGARFRGWLFEERPRPYNSFGNRSTMRVAFAERPGSARGQPGDRPGSDRGQPGDRPGSGGGQPRG